MAFSKLNAFDIVTAPYTDLDGNVKTYANGDVQKALFMVLAEDNGNVLGCKLTSQDSIYNIPDFTYTLRPETHTFLKAQSHIQLTKIHTLNVFSCTKIGEVAPFCRPHILNQLKLFFNTLIKIAELQVNTSTYESPNKRVRAFGGVVYKEN